MSPDALSVVEPEDDSTVKTRRWDLPNGWMSVPLDDVTEPSEKSDPRKVSCPFTYIDVSAIAAGRIIRAQKLNPEDAPSRARQLIRRGDTLFSGVRVYLKNIGLVDETYDGAIASTAFCVLRPSPALDANYLYRFVTWQKFTNSLLPLQRGNSPPAVLDSDVKAQQIPLPPFPEQRRIVARIDELFAELAEGEATLQCARQGLGTWRRALLKAAVTGELTRDWREANRPSETGADLLARIRAERGDPRPRSGRGRRVTAPSCFHTALLPEGWVWTTLKDLIVSGPSNGYSPKKSIDGLGTLALKLTATTRGSIDLSDEAVKRLSEVIDKKTDLFLRSGDLLFQRGNTIDYVGIAAVYEGPEETYAYPDLMIRVRTGDEILTRWIWRVANSPVGRKYMRDNATGTAGTMPKINGEILRSPYRAKAGCTISAGSRRTRFAPPGMVPVLS